MKKKLLLLAMSLIIIPLIGMDNANESEKKDESFKDKFGGAELYDSRNVFHWLALAFSNMPNPNIAIANTQKKLNDNPKETTEQLLHKDKEEKLPIHYAIEQAALFELNYINSNLSIDDAKIALGNLYDFIKVLLSKEELLKTVDVAYPYVTVLETKEKLTPKELAKKVFDSAFNPNTPESIVIKPMPPLPFLHQHLTEIWPKEWAQQAIDNTNNNNVVDALKDTKQENT